MRDIMSEQGSTNARIRSFIVKKFPAARKTSLRDDLALLESGIVDSLGILDVVAFLEQTFCIKVEDEDLTPENFGSIERLTNFCQRKTVAINLPAV
jgi:acyl carrier protein